MPEKISLRSPWLIGSLLLAIDRLAKYFFLFLGGSLGPNFLRLVLNKNSNIFFNLPLPTAFSLTLVAVFWLIIILIVTLTKNKSQRFLVASALIIVGGFSNLMDRLLFGYVIDYLSLFNSFIFNLADLYLIWGVINLLIFYKQKNVR